MNEIITKIAEILPHQKCVENLDSSLLTNSIISNQASLIYQDK
jgi:hypothetical protein